MIIPFGRMIVDKNADPSAVYLFNPRYKWVPVGEGEPCTLKEVIDWDATAKESAVIYNIGERKSNETP